MTVSKENSPKAESWGERDAQTTDAATLLATADNHVAEGETRWKRGKRFAIRRFSSFPSFVPPKQSWPPPTYVRFLPEEARQFRCITGWAVDFL